MGSLVVLVMSCYSWWRFCHLPWSCLSWGSYHQSEGLHNTIPSANTHAEDVKTLRAWKMFLMNWSWEMWKNQWGSDLLSGVLCHGLHKKWEKNIVTIKLFQLLIGWMLVLHVSGSVQLDIVLLLIFLGIFGCADLKKVVWKVWHSGHLYHQSSCHSSAVLWKFYLGGALQQWIGCKAAIWILVYRNT